MKRVGVIIRYNNFNNIDYYVIKKDVIDWLNNKVIIIPIILNNYKNVLNLIKLCDGIILTGGDILCKLDYKIIDYIYKKDIPCLGICLGMQLMGLYKKGKIKHLKLDNHYNIYHDVIINLNKLKSPIFNKNRVRVLSRHHDVLIKTKLNVIAKSNEGYIEGVEDPKKRFFIGIGWHPESFKTKDSDMLINYFIKKL